ncbi:MAG: hypothetical protein MJA28_12285 [Gammaproteobacteria bacterium]|nr:hypothetical protein [Gammaproteobacteria bacterium]
MKKTFLSMCLMTMLSACATTAPSTTSQTMLLSSLTMLYEQHVSTLDYQRKEEIKQSEQALQKKFLEYNLSKRLKGRRTLSSEEAKNLSKKYAAALAEQREAIQTTYNEKLKRLDSIYQSLVSLVTENASYISGYKQNTNQAKQLQADYQSKLEAMYVLLTQ